MFQGREEHLLLFWNPSRRTSGVRPTSHSSNLHAPRATLKQCLSKKGAGSSFSGYVYRSSPPGNEIDGSVAKHCPASSVRTGVPFITGDSRAVIIMLERLTGKPRSHYRFAQSNVALVYTQWALQFRSVCPCPIATMEQVLQFYIGGDYGDFAWWVRVSSSPPFLRRVG